MSIPYVTMSVCVTSYSKSAYGTQWRTLMKMLIPIFVAWNDTEYFNPFVSDISS